MGNQNKTQGNIEIIREQDQRCVINLDEIVEQWAWHIWNKTKTKSLSRFKREDLLIKINWEDVLFRQDNVCFFNSSSSYFPRTIFRTNFDNKTTNEQSYTFQTKRSTYSLSKFTFTHSLTKSHQSNIIFHLPEQMIQLNTGIQREQSIPFGQDTTKEYEIPWNINNQIHVPSHTRIIADLNIDEEEISSLFSVSFQFSGRIKATIATHQSPNIYLKFINGDIIEIISQAIKTNHQLNLFEILQGNSPSICFTMYGKCLFRYGVNQHIILNEEPLPSAPLDYYHLNI